MCRRCVRFFGMEEYKQIALSFKDQGNAAFQEGDNQLAIDYYTQAIELDPDNHVFYSNRCAAYMKSDSISKALRDAEKCVELAPEWSKGYSRLGAAQQALKRFQPAMDTFRKGIELDPDNKGLWASLRAAEEGYEADKKLRYVVAAQERAYEEELLKQKNEAKRKAAEAAETEKNAKNEEDMLNDFLSSLPAEEQKIPSEEPKEARAEPQSEEEVKGDEAPAPPEVQEEALLEGFFSELNEAAKEKEKKKEADDNAKHTELLNEKYTKQDLGTPMEQYQRLTCPHYEFKNQNPYAVLQLDIDATMEDIKYRYRKLSAKVHPDKLRDVENSRLAFEELKDAYQKLCDEGQRNTIVMNIEHVRSEVMKERRKLISKGMQEHELNPLQEQIEKRTMKHFAEMYLQKKKSEKNIHAHNSRERMFEDEEKNQMERFEAFEKDWSELDRREKRVGTWRDFQVAPDAKKVKAAHFKEETRNNGKHGVIQLETWKKKWK